MLFLTPLITTTVAPPGVSVVPMAGPLERDTTQTVHKRAVVLKRTAPSRPLRVATTTPNATAGAHT